MGPAMSGVGIALIGEQNVLFINAGAYLVSAFCLLPVRIQCCEIAGLLSTLERIDLVDLEDKTSIKFQRQFV